MKIRLDSHAYSFIVVIVILLFLFSLTLRWELFPAKLLPWIAISATFICAVVGLVRRILAKERAGEDTERVGWGQEGGRGWRGYMILVWIVGLYVVFYVFGILIGTALFVLPYMKFHGTRWWVAAMFAILTPAFIYGLFKVVLGVYLYNGLFLPS